MRRLRALLLLGAMLTNPVGIVAAVVFPASDCCCCCGAGGMCPMHHGRDESSPLTVADYGATILLAAQYQQISTVLRFKRE